MSDTLRAELWAVLDREPQSDGDLVETVRNLRAELARRDTTIAGAARELIEALAADEEWDHLIVEARTIDAAAALRRSLAALSAPVEAGAPAEPGYQRIADAIEGALDAAALALWMSPTNDPDSDSDVAEPYLRLARVLDKAGLIDWSAFAGAPAEPTSDTEP